MAKALVPRPPGTPGFGLVAEGGRGRALHYSPYE